MSKRHVLRSWRTCALVGAVLWIIAGSVAPAAADPEPEPSLQTEPDTEALARQMGITPEEAVRRYGWHTAFSLAANAIEEEMPAAYADSAITGPYRASVLFAGKVPNGVARYFKALPKHVDVELTGGAPFPRAELLAEMEQHHRKMGQDPEVDQALSSVDAKRGVIQVVVKPRNRDKGARPELRAKLLALATKGSRIPIELTFTDHSLGELHMGMDRGWSPFTEWTPWSQFLTPRFLRFQLPFAATH